MEKENSTTHAHVVSLEVLDLDEDNLVELLVDFTKPKLPVTMENVAAQQDISRWDYLAKVTTPEIDADTGLLVGMGQKFLNQRRSFQASVAVHTRQEPSSVGWLKVRSVGRHMLMLTLPASSRLTCRPTNSLRTIATWNSMTLHTVKLHQCQPITSEP